MEKVCLELDPEGEGAVWRGRRECGRQSGTQQGRITAVSECLLYIWLC